MDGLTALIGSLTALVVALTGAATLALKLRQDLQQELRKGDAVTDRRVDQMWEAYMLRAQLAAAKRTDLVAPKQKEAAVEDALVLREKAKEAFEPIAPALRILLRSLKDPTSAQFAEAVNARYGKWIVKHICAVLGVSDMECFAMAQSVAEEEDPGVPAAG